MISGRECGHSSEFASLMADLSYLGSMMKIFIPEIKRLKIRIKLVVKYFIAVMKKVCVRPYFWGLLVRTVIICVEDMRQIKFSCDFFFEKKTRQMAADGLLL